MDSYELLELEFEGKKVTSKLSVCPVVNCNCGDMSLEFNIPALPLEIELNVYSREITADQDDSTAEDEDDNQLQQKFLRSISEKQWEALFRRYMDMKRRQAAASRLEEYYYIFNFNGIEKEGELTTYCDVFPFDVPMEIESGSTILTVIDYHCLNPNCGCHDTAVEFVNLRDCPEDEDPQSFGIFMLDYQKQTWDLMPGEEDVMPGEIPMQVLRNLVESQNPEFYKELAKHHKKLKELYQLRRTQAKTGAQKKGKNKRR